MYPIHDTLIQLHGEVLGRDVSLGEAQSMAHAPLAPVRCGTVYGVLLNDPRSLQALGDVSGAPYKGAPRAPVLYIKPRNTHLGNGHPIEMPDDTETLQMGPALGAVIGKVACRLDEAKALDAVAGYTIANDISVPHDNFYRPSVRLRACDGFCPMGPWVRGRTAIADPDNLVVRTWIDDELRQTSSTRGFLRPLARLLAEITDFMTLNPGDILLTGIAFGAPLAQAGQRVAIEIEHIGRLENHLIAGRPALGDMR